ncbi:hypothetical protein C943_03945 [Mariniradius saccharolyticus AK6]|uniref:Uncharacterized protein n=1 Tax=Mariniradius saccharolyticus AK6 TaxID=1239962 RepID=M7XHT9_9BACT|nr:hypothetical protein C943_03945 [Mariniradius saccharolyticus AK6]
MKMREVLHGWRDFGLISTNLIRKMNLGNDYLFRHKVQIKDIPSRCLQPFQSL